MHPQGVGHDRLDHVGVGDGDPQGGVAVLRGDPRVPPSYGGDGARLYVLQTLAAWELDTRRMVLDDPPQLQLGELGQLATGPLAVVALGQSDLDIDRWIAAVAHQQLRGLSTAFERAGDDACGVQRRESFSQPPCLIDASIVKQHAR